MSMFYHDLLILGSDLINYFFDHPVQCAKKEAEISLHVHGRNCMAFIHWLMLHLCSYIYTA